MNGLNCREIDDLLAPYAADALEDADRTEVSSHLAECRNHDSELSAFRADLARLGRTVSPVEPPAELRAKLLDAFDREAGATAGPAAAAPPAPIPLPEPAQRPERRQSLFAMPSFAYALAAAFLLLAIGLGAWGAGRGGGDNGQITYAQTDAQQRSLQVTYLPSRDIAILNTTLPPLPNDRTYQAWSIVNGQARSIGVLRPTGPNAFEVDLSGTQAIALTVEPAGGSTTPTTDPFLVTSLQEG
jgi:anti-sigma-K factor RskA